jgi:hypothetical protein
MTIAQFHTRVSRWIIKSLLPIAPEGQRVVDIFLRKADEELAEFKAEMVGTRSVLRPIFNKSAIAEEAIDVCVTVLAAAGAVVTGDELTMAAERKMAVLEAGDWYYNAELGVFKRRKT